VITVDRRRPQLLWTPAAISTEAWLRPDDASTITIATGVAELRDRKGNGRNFPQATPATQPTIVANSLNGKAGLRFNGSQWLTSASTAATWNFLHTTTGGTVVAVWRAGTSSNPNAGYGLLGNNAVGTSNHGFCLVFDDRSSATRNEKGVGFVTRGVSGFSTAVNASADLAHPPNTPVIITHISNPGAAAASRSMLRINGVSFQNNTEVNAASSANASFALQLGAAGNNVFPLVGDIWEVVILPGTSVSTAELVEGYLAGPAEWNLQGSLAAGHPYKSAAPTL
jgi:hypothetical protein